MGDANAGIQILVTAMGSNALQVAETRKLVDLLLNKKVTFEQIDGSSDADLRNKMWEKSGKRSYPQIFLNGEFWGDLDMIQSLVDNNEFDKTFAAYMTGPTPRNTQQE